MVVRLSTVFLANRLTDLVTMRSILPARASSIMRLKPSRCGAGARDVLIRVDAAKLPVGIFFDKFRIVVYLSLVAGKLLVTVQDTRA